MEDHQDSAELNFDPVWQKAQCLNICEVEQLLRQPYARLVESGRTSAKTQCLEQSYKHALRFSKITDPEALTELRAALEDWEPPTAAQGGKLHSFEMAQLVSLLPENASVAKSLIPSMSRYSDNDLDQLLADITTYKSFGGGMGLEEDGQDELI
ncbi:DNA-directed RNA polymerase II 16 kDa polypeptide, putative [Perkinsus marinus ATCC 50983]|uniref:DNA-directed RNA polymerase II 16 kDa polypeptide, putative n=1 Tax=Perkinsus marinus (strain ATCC 50983 / TXsc) TaxID=423536 RepID=C5KFU5_PERM5|nr:DNA-directed RNA polymerase II 16 kDa polypeptide, putative [Perkinsus marinus ATCC 50983]EER16647.1 DNA-directed RNA polymerase II 16 kDa polypeptide, putative [Perkinsus marinus ATCC 50983]|eukprot:XP_002784851.1 DNA-directed RNA polymerase II 16 kDa polypeptide, putative [Perkinsus marinus ATCC 50983]